MLRRSPTRSDTGSGPPWSGSLLRSRVRGMTKCRAAKPAGTYWKFSSTDASLARTVGRDIRRSWRCARIQEAVMVVQRFIPVHGVRRAPLGLLVTAPAVLAVGLPGAASGSPRGCAEPRGQPPVRAPSTAACPPGLARRDRAQQERAARRPSRHGAAPEVHLRGHRLHPGLLRDAARQQEGQGRPGVRPANRPQMPTARQRTSRGAPPGR